MLRKVNVDDIPAEGLDLVEVTKLADAVIRDDLARRNDTRLPRYSPRCEPSFDT